MPDHYSDVLC